MADDSATVDPAAIVGAVPADGAIGDERAAKIAPPWLEASLPLMVLLVTVGLP